MNGEYTDRELLIKLYEKFEHLEKMLEQSSKSNEDAHRRIDKIFYAGLVLSGTFLTVIITIGLKVFVP